MAETMGVSRPAVREVLRALELLGIVKPVPGGGNYITEDLDTWLIGPLSILFKLNNGYLRQNQQFRAALERESAILAARKCTPLNAAELWMILARWTPQKMKRYGGNWIANFTRRSQRSQITR